MDGFTLLKNAHAKKQVKVQFEIPIEGSKIPVILTVGDRLAIAETQDRIYQIYYSEYQEKGLDRKPVNEIDFEAELDRFKDDADTLKILKDQKPKNLADQMAKKYSRLRTIQEVIPQFLKNPNGTPFLKTEEQKLEMQEIIKEDNDLWILLAGKYTELFVKAKDIEIAVKN